jgi:serine/threonine-protein kinase
MDEPSSPVLGVHRVADLVGKKLKDFYVLRRLGRGAMAEVYLAQQVSLDRQVALKVLNADLAIDPNYVRRFHHEAKAAAALVHGGIVQIYEVGEQDGVHYIAQEYVAGRNLGEVIRSSGSLPPGLTLDILRQVTSALHKAASQGIVHRDVKPENIMVAAATGEVKVADFGLARVQGDGRANFTQIGVTMGTPLYMSPEQIEGRELDSRSDIYSLGITAYHMLAGEPPFSGDSPLTVALQHLNHPATSLAIRRPGLPPRLVQTVERMMAKLPEDRFNDPAALANELHSVAADGSREGWAAPPDSWSLTQMILAANQRAEATTRLDDLMKTSAASGARSNSGRRIAAALVACALLGIVVAAVARPKSLLEGAQAGPATRKTIWEQIYQAKSVDTAAAWEAALNHRDPAAGEYHKNLARQGLALHYLLRPQHRDYEKVIEPLEHLAASAQPRFKAFGIAGLVVAYANLYDDDQALIENQRLSAEDRNLLQEQEPRMNELFLSALDELAKRRS